VPKTASASQIGAPPKGKGGAFCFYAISFQSVNGKACGSMAASLFFYFFLLH
jgi:hypothetical protein